jgi:glutathione gamma-glutamylcysteinyltransferase
MPPEFYQRPLPPSCTPFTSAQGRQLFSEALSAGGLECYFDLAAQFTTQNEPAFCGLGTLSMALNALRVDPGRIWKGVWRWYDESLLDCCKELELVKHEGVTLDEFACLARCNSCEPTMQRAQLTPDSLDAFRTAGACAASHPRCSSPRLFVHAAFPQPPRRPD